MTCILGETVMSFVDSINVEEVADIDGEENLDGLEDEKEKLMVELYFQDFGNIHLMNILPQIELIAPLDYIQVVSPPPEFV